MIPYDDLKIFNDEAQIKLKEIHQFLKKETKLWKQNLLQTCPEYREITTRYPNLSLRITSSTCDVTLKKLIPVILKMKKTKKTKSKLLKKRFTKLYEALDSGEVNYLDLLKKIRLCKIKYEEFTKQLHKLKLQEQQKMLDYMEEKFPQIKEKCQSLYTGILEEKFEPKTTSFMLKTYKDFYNNKLSNHDASVKFGTHLVDNYIKPHLKKK